MLIIKKNCRRNRYSPVSNEPLSDKNMYKVKLIKQRPEQNKGNTWKYLNNCSKFMSNNIDHMLLKNRPHAKPSLEGNISLVELNY